MIIEVPSPLDPGLFWAAMQAQRGQQGLSWREVAEACGLPGGSLYKGARCTKTPRPEALRALLLWLGRPLSDFLVVARPTQMSCQVCRALFVPRNKGAKYCSFECSETSYTFRHPRGKLQRLADTPPPPTSPEILAARVGTAFDHLHLFAEAL